MFHFYQSWIKLKFAKRTKTIEFILLKGQLTTSDSCYVCSAAAAGSNKWNSKWNRVVSGAANGIDLTFTFPCKAVPNFKGMTCSSGDDATPSPTREG